MKLLVVMLLFFKFYSRLGFIIRDSDDEVDFESEVNNIDGLVIESVVVV